MKVVFFQRRTPQGAFSIEGLYDTVRKNLPPSIEYKVNICPYFSVGLFPRIGNTLWAAQNQGHINHIAGDVHYITLLMRKNKTILSIMDCAFLYNSTGIKRWFLLWFWLKIPVMRAKIVTTLSENSKQDIIKYTGCEPDKIKVIPCSIAEHFKYKPKVFNQKKPVILQIGTKWNKNIARLIEALEGIPCTLDIVGKLDEKAKETLHKFNIDYINSWNLSDAEILEKYHNCDLLAFISTAEGFGMPIVEAQAVGRAVITSNISPMKEVANECACLVDPINAEDIKRGLIEVIQNTEYREQLIIEGLVNCRLYKTEHIVEKYLDIYSETYIN